MGFSWTETNCSDKPHQRDIVSKDIGQSERIYYLWNRFDTVHLSETAIAEAGRACKLVAAIN
jgi:hypothetical protein